MAQLAERCSNRSQYRGSPSGAGSSQLNCQMNPYPKYATTVIGAHSVPDWYESLDRLVSVGQLSMAAMADAQYRVGHAAILDQELAGIDVMTGGETYRRTHNRHSPPNAMLNYFWQKFRPSRAPPSRSRSPRTTRMSSILLRPAGAASSTTSTSDWSMNSAWCRR
jgi:hypothetical protein